MNISQANTQAYQKLNKVKINSASLDAELLLSFVLHKSREYILAHPDFKLRKNQILKFNKLIAARAKNIPLAYLTQVKEFYGRNFYVDKRVLVPRPETEMIIEQLRIKNYELKINTTIIDVGTGSGCIITTAACELKNKNLKLFATDISQDALTVARKNARVHGVAKKIKFLRGNLLSPVLSFLRRQESRNKKNEIIICANLPYLTSAQIKNSPTIKREPKLALAAGADGLKYYRELAVQVQKFNNQYPNVPISIYCEIDPKQSNAIKKVFSSVVIPARLAGAKPRRTKAGISPSYKPIITIKKDLAGRDRLAIVKF
jgi:release factor glutamine methyltransferase